ncbi:MAG: TIGR02449 family protein [Proteobacteria bacterium]|nr:TIGR02449 family protein [Pseudomonadota bacterium]
MDEIQTLEKSINLLVSKLERTMTENKALAAKMEELIIDKSALMRKNDQAKTRLESMISRLKNLEQTV